MLDMTPHRFKHAALALTLLAPLMLPVPALAIDLDSARSQGLVGERADGLVGGVADTAEVNALVKAINAARLADYRDISNREGTKLEAVQAVAGAKQVQRAQDNGWYYLDGSGKWKKP